MSSPPDARSSPRAAVPRSSPQSTERRIGALLGVTTVIAEVLPGDKSSKVAELQAQGRKVAMVGGGVNDAPLLPKPTSAWPSAGTEVAIEAADIVLMRSDLPRRARGLADRPRNGAQDAPEPRMGDRRQRDRAPDRGGCLRTRIRARAATRDRALSMTGSSVLVAVNALVLKRLRLPSLADVVNTGDGAAAVAPTNRNDFGDPSRVEA